VNSRDHLRKTHFTEKRLHDRSMMRLGFPLAIISSAILVLLSILLYTLNLMDISYFHSLTPTFFSIYLLVTIMAIRRVKYEQRLYSPLSIFVVSFFLFCFCNFILYSYPASHDWFLLLSFGGSNYRFNPNNLVKLKTFILLLEGYIAFILGYSIRSRSAERFQNDYGVNRYSDFLPAFFFFSVIWLIAKIFINLVLNIGVMGLSIGLELPFKIQGILYYSSGILLFYFLALYFATAIDANRPLHIFASIIFISLSGVIEALVLRTRGRALVVMGYMVVISYMLRAKRRKIIYIYSLTIICLFVIAIPFISLLRNQKQATVPDLPSFAEFHKDQGFDMVIGTLAFILNRLSRFDNASPIIEYAEKDSKSNMLSSLVGPAGSIKNFFTEDITGFYTHEILGISYSAVTRSEPTLWGYLFIRSGYIGTFIFMFIWGIVNKVIFDYIVRQKHIDFILYSIFVITYLFWFFNVTFGGNVVAFAKEACVILLFFCFIPKLTHK